MTLLLRYWWAGAIAALAFVVAVQRADLARKDAKLQHAADVMQITVERISRASAEAEAADRRHAAEVVAAQDNASKEITDALAPQLAAARADAAAYARRLREQSAGPQRGGRKPDMPAAASAAVGFDAADPTTELDAAACADAVTIAEGWQAWWHRQSTIAR